MPGAVLTRVAASHIRVGTFQFFASRGDTEGVRRLADHVIARHYPEAADAERPYRALLEGVIARQAELVARWLLVGFIHGVMNTDNSSISGETIDYGPCAFMDHYDPGHGVLLDRRAGPLRLRQPAADRAVESDAAGGMPVAAVFRRQGQGDRGGPGALGAFAEIFNAAYQAGLRRKTRPVHGARRRRGAGAGPAGRDGQEPGRFYADLPAAERCCAGSRDDGDVRQLFADPTAFDEWAARWRQRTGDEPQIPPTRRTAMRSVNPAFIPRNHRVEAVIEAAVNRDDFAPFEELLTVLSKPFEDQPAFAAYAEPPEPHQRVLQTFCGT